MSKESLTIRDFEKAASRLKCDVPAIQAVAYVESGKNAFYSDGFPVILFERHIFHRLTKGKFSKDHPDISNAVSGGYGAAGANQRRKFSRAFALDPKAAMMACSWGKFQILGENYEVCGYQSVDAFVDAMKESEAKQLDAFVSFVIGNDLAKALRSHDWTAFARGYNGSGYKKNKYDVRMAAAHRRFSKAYNSSAGASTRERPGSLTEGNAPTDNHPTVGGDASHSTDSPPSDTGDAENTGNEGRTVIQSADNIVNTGDAAAADAPKVVVEKEERVEVKEGFFKRLWAKIVAAATGLGGADALMDKAQQAQTLGLPNAFWTRFFIVLCILAAVWLIYELWTGLVHPWVINRRRRQRTDLLVAANTSPNGAVMLAKTADLKKYEAEGWVVVRRGASSTISADTGE